MRDQGCHEAPDLATDTTVGGKRFDTLLVCVSRGCAIDECFKLIVVVVVVFDFEPACGYKTLINNSHLVDSV